MYGDSQSESDDSSNHGSMSESFNHAAAAAPPDFLLQTTNSTPPPPPTIVMPLEERNNIREGDGCHSTVISQRLRILWATLVGVAILGISAFSSDETPTERAVYKEAFDVNAPPGLEERAYRKQIFILEESRLEQGDNSSNSSELPFPVLDADDDVPLQKVPETAVEALECRESVINFVINATDAKDECNGLKKAFDMTCNNDETPSAKASADPASSENPKSNRRQRQRRLFESKSRQQRPKLALQVYKVTCTLRDFARMHLWLFRSSKDELFFPEHEIVSSASWEEARYQVLNNYDMEVHQYTRRRLFAEQELINRARILEEANATNSTVEFNATVVEQLNQTVVSKPTDKKKVSLSMPTNKLHASDQMLSDTVMLGKEKQIQEAMKVYSNQTNVTLSAAQEDAAASSKAVHDTAAAVSAVLNDPESVEARVCCASILNVYHEHCDTSSESNDMVSDSNLFIIVFIIAVCGAVKSMIRHFKIRWLPEAAGCILVGVLFGGVMSFIPHYDLSFDHDWFLRIMVPPIVFEAALSIDKRSFRKHIVPILVYAVIGTLFATAVTAFIVHKGSSMLNCETIPYVESLTFGALISSIDPIAVLSVLSNLGMTDTDAIYVVIFGESLLNDGVAMVLFQTLVHFMDETLVIDREAFFLATRHFLVVALGSVMVGSLSGMACTCYFYAFKGCQTPLVEVLTFFCWAFVPYYICDGVEWSGIVAIVTTGIVMDLYVVGQHSPTEEGGLPTTSIGTPSVESVSQRKFDRNTLGRRVFLNKGHLSDMARTHVGFVTEILSTMMETAIFSYLGFFLFSYRYHWNFWHVTVAIAACCVSRAIMIPLLSLLANWIASMQQSRSNCRAAVHQLRRGGTVNDSGVTIGGRMQLVLWFAGLRGAMSFALVENIPLYDAVTGEGSRMKAELKAMTSACIIFTVFVMGGCTDYVIERLGMSKSGNKGQSDVELTSLLSQANGRIAQTNSHDSAEDMPKNGSPKQKTFRQRSRQ